jgi:hypothetical protein
LRGRARAKEKIDRPLKPEYVALVLAILRILVGESLNLAAPP